MSNDAIRYSMFLVYYDLGRPKSIRNLFIKFLRLAFPQFKNTEWRTIIRNFYNLKYHYHLAICYDV